MAFWRLSFTVLILTIYALLLVVFSSRLPVLPLHVRHYLLTAPAELSSHGAVASSLHLNAKGLI